MNPQSTLSLYEQAKLCRWVDEKTRLDTLKSLEFLLSDAEKSNVGSFEGTDFEQNEVVRVVISDSDYLKMPLQAGSYVVLKQCLRHVVGGEIFFLTENADGIETIIHISEVEAV